MNVLTSITVLGFLIFFHEMGHFLAAIFQGIYVDGFSIGFGPSIIQKKFKDITSCPILVNTSFNVRGEPIVCSVEDSFKCFMGTNLDILVCENFILFKEKQNKSLLQDYKNKFEKD